MHKIKLFQVIMESAALVSEENDLIDWIWVAGTKFF